MFLRPGNNTVPLRGILDIDTAVRNIGTLLAAETSMLGQGKLMLSASGHSTIYNGLHIPYYEQVLNHLSVTANVPILRVLFDTISEFASTNSDTVQGVTSALQNTDLTTSPNMTASKG